MAHRHECSGSGSTRAEEFHGLAIKCLKGAKGNPTHSDSRRCGRFKDTSGS